MNEELEACPFCGRRTYLRVEELDDRNYQPPQHRTWVRCDNCFAAGPEKGTREGAIEAWNGRV